MSGSKLKWIAIVTMLIDHIGAVIIEHYLRYADAAVRGGQVYDLLDRLDNILRCIGRLAFPLFIFLLVEGFFHTKNRWKYLLRLTIFCFISDIPFDLGVYLTNEDVKNGTYWTLSQQNVFFTLAIGFLGMIILEKLSEMFSEKAQIILCFIAVSAFAYLLAEYLHTDYSGGGAVAILAAYAAKKYGVMKGRLQNEAEIWILVGVLTIMCHYIEAIAFVDSIFVRQYDGTRGKTISRWFFYIFYPAHFFILFLIRFFLLG